MGQSSKCFGSKFQMFSSKVPNVFKGSDKWLLFSHLTFGHFLLAMGRRRWADFIQRIPRNRNGCGGFVWEKRNQSDDKPGSVLLVRAMRCGAAVPVIYLRRASPHVSIVLPSGVPCGLGRATLKTSVYADFQPPGYTARTSPHGW